MVFDTDSVNDPVVRGQLRVAQLESNKTSLIRQVNDNLQRISRLEEQCASGQGTIKLLESDNLRLQQEFIKEKERANRLESVSEARMTKKQAAMLKAESENCRVENSQLRGALGTFRSLHEAAVREAKTLRLSIGRSDDEVAHLRKEVREIQSVSDENALIGKLFNQVLAEKWTEAAFNKKYESMLDELRRARMELNEKETKLRRREDELLDLENASLEKVRQLEKQVYEAGLMSNPQVTLGKLEELSLGLKRASNQKLELEIANKKLRADCSETQVRLDSYIMREQTLRDLEVGLKGKYSDELSAKVIELSEKLSGFKLAELKAQREAALVKEREEYYMRVNKTQTGQIVALEELVAKNEASLAEREGFWRAKHIEQARLASRAEDERQAPEKKNLEQVRRIVNEGVISMDQLEERREPERLGRRSDMSGSFIDSEMQIYRDKVKFLEDDVKYKDLMIQKLERERETKQVGVNYRTDNVEIMAVHDLEKKTRDIAQAAQQTVMTLQGMIEEKSKLLADKDKRIDRLLEEIGEKAKENSRLEIENENLKRQVNTGERARMNVEQYTALRTIDKISKMEQKDIERLVADYENKLGILSGELIEAERVNKELLQELRHNRVEKMTSNNSATAEKERTELEALKQKNEMMTGLYKKKCQEVKSLNSVLQKYSEDLEKKQEEISKIKIEEGHKVVVAKNEGGHNEEKIAVLTKKFATLNDQLKEDKKVIQELKTNEIKHREKVSELNEKISKLTEMNTKLKDENSKLSAKKLSNPPATNQGIGTNRRLQSAKKQQPDSLPNISQSSEFKQAPKPEPSKPEKNEEMHRLTQDNKLLREEVEDLRNRMAASPGTEDFINKEGYLFQKDAMSFTDQGELIKVLQKYQQHAGPKFNYFAVMKRADNKNLGFANFDRVFLELEYAGVKFQPRDHEIIKDYIPKDAGGLMDYKKFYYMIKGGLADFSQTINREDILQPAKEKSIKPSHRDAGGVHAAVLDKNVDLLKKKLLDKEKEILDLNKQVRNWKQTALGYEAELKDNTNINKGSKYQKNSTTDSLIKLNRGENLKQIQDLEDQILTLKKDMKYEIEKREQVMKEQQEDLSEKAYEVALSQSEASNLRAQLARLMSAKISPENMNMEREKEKELLVSSLMEKLEKSRKTEEDLRVKLRSIERENIDLKHVKEGIDTKLENLNKEIRELKDRRRMD